MEAAVVGVAVVMAVGKRGAVEVGTVRVRLQRAKQTLATVSPEIIYGIAISTAISNRGGASASA
jgi:hypothetical protein